MSSASFEVRVAGLVPPELLAGLGELTVCELETRTVLTASFIDQAALHDFLERLKGHDLDLVELHAIEDLDDD